MVLIFVNGAASAVSPVKQTDLAYTNSYGASKNYVFKKEKDGVVVADSSGSLVSDKGITLPGQDVDLLIGGRIRHEGVYFDKTLTLRDDFNDRYAFNRTKINLDFHSQHGLRTYGKPAIDMHTTLTSMTIWDDANTYTPLVEEPTLLNRGNHLLETEFDSHKHKGVVPLLYLDEGWVRLYVDTILEMTYPLRITIGHFPFILGRGVALGDYPDGAEKYLGWHTPGNPGNATHRSPGILLSADLTDWCTLELYYSLWKKRSHGLDFTRKVINARRLDVENRNSIEALERGTHNDTMIFAARLGIKHQFSHNNSLYVEPYALFIDAPELTLEFEGDSAARIATFGCMAEYNNSGFSFNAEVASQFGSHTVHPIDRNHVILGDSYYRETATTFGLSSDPNALPQITLSKTGGRLDMTGGSPARYNSHVLLGVKNLSNREEYLPYRAYYLNSELTDVINSPQNRDLSAQGAQLKDTDGSTYKSQKFTTDIINQEQQHQYGAYMFKTGVDYYDQFVGILTKTPNGTLYNAAIPFGYGTRFRKGYTLDMSGIMAMVDIAYALPSKKARFALAAGYISGDEYPFNEENNKVFSGFVPFKDANYVGRQVTSFALLYCRKLPRPTNFVDGIFAAENAYESITNLSYIGCGGQVHLDSEKRLRLEINALQFWMPVAPYTWDTSAERQFTGHADASKLKSIYAHIQEKEIIFAGDQTMRRASSNLGSEINMVLSCRMTDNLECAIRAGIFIPGKLYSDISGMPNKNTVRYDRDGRRHHESLGTLPAIGGMLRITYKF